VITESKKSDSKAQRKFLWAFIFFLPALFFQSSLFAFVSPLPFFIATLKDKSWIALLSLFSNSAIIYLLEKDVSISLIPVWFWLSIGITFPLLIRRTKKVPVAFFYSFIFSVVALLFTLQLFAQKSNLGMIEFVRTEISKGVDHLNTIPDHPIKKWTEEQGRSELVRNLMNELPSGVLIGIILCYWFNLLLAFRTIPGFLSNAFWGSYRNPEWLVWPTILCGFLYVYAEHALYYIGMNGLKVLLVFYGFQGLSIVTHFFNRKKIYGLIRPIVYGVIIFIASPFAFALGFFDLWFDFRRKFGQS
jgi:hypothetical protein